MTRARPSPEQLAEMFARKKAWHDRQARLPIREKFRILIELQRQELPLIRRQRRLESWQRVWEVEP